jgi:hypothetical protein
VASIEGLTQNKGNSKSVQTVDGVERELLISHA